MLKEKLEKNQRDRRLKLDNGKNKWIPRWFENVNDKYSDDGKSWRYKGGYWESRGKFEETDIFKL